MSLRLHRSLDLLLLLLTFPVWGLILFLVVLKTLIKDGKPVFYSQTRIGYLGKPFEIYKIRTMIISESLSDDLRITQNGYFLRDWSLDEIPQVWNIIKGEMSLIGPRPLLWSYKNQLTPKIDELRHSVRPGLTGWAQINGRNEISWEEKLELDTWYITHSSYLLHFKILLKTIPIWLLRKGIYTKDGKMMPTLSKN